jgi:fatty acid desaturase
VTTSSLVPGSNERTVETSLSRHTTAYAQLKADIVSAGILRRSYSFYAAMIVFAFGGYALSIWAIVEWRSYLALTLACLGVSFFTVQLAGLMHDAGHRAVFRSIRYNNLLGLASTAMIAMVFPSWTERHNQHHAKPNQEGADPDIEIPFIALSTEDYESKDAAQRFTTRWQAYYYYPLGAIVGFSNRFGNITYFMRHPKTRENLLRLAIYIPAMVVLFAAPFIVFPLEKALFVFFLTHISTGIYLASCFAPNHKGMRAVERGAELSFLEQQVTTSRNVSGGLLTDILLVGLNYQIEHHLFPNCPRNKLGQLRSYVRAVCTEHDLEYTEVSFLRTNQFLVRHLHGVSRARGTLQAAATS